MNAGHDLNVARHYYSFSRVDEARDAHVGYVSVPLALVNGHLFFTCSPVRFLRRMSLFAVASIDPSSTHKVHLM